jgi:bifunctional non-homologous end joining protein LigD
MPLDWAEVTDDLDPKRFTIRTARRHLDGTKAWEGYRDAERKLTDAMKRLGKIRPPG